MASFSFLDIVMVILYLILMIGIGLWAASGQTSQRDYFLGGRQLPWWVVGLSIIATETSALTFIGIPAAVLGGLSIDEATGSFVFGGGNLFFILLIVGYVIGRSLIAIYIVPMYFTGDVYTPYQLLNRAFGAPARYAAGFLSYVGIAMGAGVRVYVTAIPVMIVMKVYFPDWDLALSILVIMIAAMIYTSIGGIKAVVWTDMIQFFIFVIGGTFALFYIPSLLTGDLSTANGAEGWAAVQEVAGGDGVLQWWNTGILSTAAVAENAGVAVDSVTTGQLIIANIKNILGGPYNIIMGILPISIGIIFAFGFDQLNVQRILGCSDVKEGRKAMMLSAVLILPQFMLFLLIGAVLYSYYVVNGMVFGDILPMDPTTGEPNASFVFPIFIITHMPVIMKGFLVAAILAAAMSSVSSAISAMSSISVMDFYRPLTGGGKKEKELRVSQIGSIIAGVLLTAVAFICSGVEELINLAFTVAGLTAGPILGAFLYAMWRRRGHPVPVVTGMLTGFFFMIAANIAWQKELIWGVSWAWHAPLGAAVCLITTLALATVFTDDGGRDVSRQEVES